MYPRLVASTSGRYPMASPYTAITSSSRRPRSSGVHGTSLIVRPPPLPGHVSAPPRAPSRDGDGPRAGDAHQLLVGGGEHRRGHAAGGPALAVAGPCRVH